MAEFIAHQMKRTPKLRPIREWISKRMVLLASTTERSVSALRLQKDFQSERPKGGFTTSTITDKIQRCGLTIMQRPSIAPSVKSRCEINAIKTCRHIGDDPEDQPKRRPWLSYNHCNIFRRESQRYHTDPVEHPVYWKGSSSISCSWICDFCMRGGRSGE